MSKERLMILEMLASQKINPEEAEILLQALGEEVLGAAEAAESLSAEQFMWGDMNQAVEAPNLPESPAAAPAPAGMPASAAAPVAPAAPNMIGRIAQILAPRAPTPAPDRRRRYPDPSYAVAMKRSGLDFSIDQLFQLQEEDIEPEQAIQMARARRPEWTTADVVELLVAGACPDLLRKLNELGFASVSPRELIELTENDVELEYLERFRGLEMIGISVRDLIQYFENDVDPQLITALKETGLITPAEIVNAAEHDLSPDFVRVMGQVMPGISVRQMIELAENDVEPEYIETLLRGGFANLTARQIIRLQEHDVDAEDAVWFRENLGEHITPHDLVRLADHDVRRDSVDGLIALHLPDLTVDTLIKLVDYDVSAEAAELAREAYGDAITAADLIEMAENG